MSLIVNSFRQAKSTVFGSSVCACMTNITIYNSLFAGMSCTKHPKKLSQALESFNQYLNANHEVLCSYLRVSSLLDTLAHKVLHNH